MWIVFILIRSFLTSILVFVLVTGVVFAAGDEKEEAKTFDELSSSAEIHFNNGEYDQAERLYRQLVGRFGLTYQGYLDLYDPPYWIQPYRGGGNHTWYITTEAYPRLIKSLVKQNNIEAALEVADGARARSLLSQLQSESSKNRYNGFVSLDINGITNTSNKTKKTFLVYNIFSGTEVFIWVVEPNGAIKFASLTLNIEEILP